MSSIEESQKSFPERLAENFRRQLKPPGQWTRRDVIKLSVASAATVGLGCLSYGFAVRDHVEVSRVAMKITELPDEFVGLTIAQLSDIHHGRYTGLDYINRCIEIVNGLNPDMIALTGDFTYGGKRYIEPCVELFRNLKAPIGVYAVLGNHDYYVGASHVSRALRNAGCNLLIDAQDRLEHRGSKLCLLGVDDLYYGNTNFYDLMGRLPKDLRTIVFSHNPDFIEEFAVREYHMDFMIAGHTHGGQIRFPLIGSPHISSSYGQRYARGLHRNGSMQVYTTRGIGTVVVPSRFDCPPEIAFYTLERA